jgi:hypothetical protein
MIDTGGDHVNTIALTMVVFTTAALRDRDRPLDVTLGDILSYFHADPPRIGRGMHPVRRLLEVGCSDANEQVIDLKGLFTAHPLPVGFPSAQVCILTSGPHEACRDGDHVVSSAT